MAAKDEPQTTAICRKCGQWNSALNSRCIACDAPLQPDSKSGPPEAPASGTPPSRDPAEPAEASLRKVSHFRLLDLLGCGGMGEVYRAYDERLDRLVALKVIRADVLKRLTSWEEEAESHRFVDEAQLAGRLDHPNIVPIHELGQDRDGTFFFAMKLVEGRTLDQLWEEVGEDRLSPVRLAEYLQIFIKVCDALSFAHDRGVIHRDLKPANIMIGGYGQVYLMDWGAALLLSKRRRDAPKTRLEVSREKSSAGTVVGTLRYMSPEQATSRRDQVDARSDVFLLGASFYHLLTGHPPYTATELPELLEQAQQCRYRRPDWDVGGGQVPPKLAEISMKAMARRPEDRYPSVSELQREIEQFLLGYWQQPNQRVPAGTRIVTEGDEGDAAYVIVEGHCAVIDTSGPERILLREMGPGDVFGEAAVFGSTRRTATVEAIDDVVLTVVTRDTLTAGLGLKSWMGLFVKALADRFSEVDQRLRQAERGRAPSS